MNPLDAQTFFRQSRGHLVLDVRSPSEFADGHVPAAINVPLFDDDQRAQVGKTYADDGRDAAVLTGLEIIGPKMAAFVRRVSELLEQIQIESPQVFIHCWRGGMRSQSFGWLLETAGLKVNILNGGYKSFRRLVLDTIGRPHPMVVLSGLTGAGKTVFLKSLRENGEQVIDLEGLANHRGSAFGSIGLGDQPSTQQFENDLFLELDQLDSDRRFWVEDEGSRIGRVVVPASFMQQIQHAPAIFLDVPQERRLDNLLVDYGSLDRAELAQATTNISKRLGGQNVKLALDSIGEGDLRNAARISLSYYDRSYNTAASKLPREITVPLPTEGLSDEAVLDEIVSQGNRLDVATGDLAPQS